MRYPDQFAYKFEIEETIADVEIPKFIIQPLVEIILCMVLTINDKTMLSRSTPTEKAKKLLWLLWIMEKESPPIG